MEGIQPPICEAFIMTGESMLKLSRNETETCNMANSHSHNHNQLSHNLNHNQNNNNNTSTRTNTSNAIADKHNNPNQIAGNTSESIQNDKQAARRLPIEFKSGFLDRKSVFEAHGKPTGMGRRGWRRVFATIKDLRLIIRATDANQEPQESRHQPQQHDLNQPAPSKMAATSATKKQDLSTKIKCLMLAQNMPNNIKLHHSYATRADYAKREYVLRLQLADQSEFLMQAGSEQEMDSWIEMINFASACLSSPALSSSVSNNRRYKRRNQKHILPASCTKLTYWEQLIDHEERLQRLKHELEEHLNEASTAKNADKRSKSEFIERIAYLRKEIERYTVYVELMRKRSNSTEAIILSKHPQNASMAPSTAIGAPSKSS